jgi:hypothetical protein
MRFQGIPHSIVKVPMTKEKLVKKIEELLKVDIDLGFLLVLEKKNLETLVACIRDRVDQIRE